VDLGAEAHDALDDRQRARLADMIEAGPRAFRGGPFRRPGFDRAGWGW
jgi:hypothetical protein